MPNWIGDFVLALSVVERMAMHRGIRPTLIVPRWLIELANLLTDFPIIAYDRDSRNQWRASRRRVARRKFESIYLLPFSFSSAWFAFWTGIPRRRGIRKDGRGILLTERLKPSVRDRSRHLLAEYCAVLDMEYRAPDRWEPKLIEAFEKYRGCVVLCPGATYGPAKRWDGFGELEELLGDERIVLLGTEGDADAYEKGPLSARSHVEDLTGKTGLAKAAGIIAAAKAVVSNDSGLMHLAGYIGTPVVGIFGSTSPRWTRPLGNAVRIACSDESCSPCFERECRFGHYDCLKSITAMRVRDLMEEITPAKRA
ncbi:MAG: lipopolysaccharide heptosyltransferase II [Chitinivibrionales bacterium]|nr:lipopolysaccharide heptosyltransferase II [Chitinivibrionales bacterium]MBD3394770.1 lipopolysaccharide heptosyltransferase II [Chitinivibrionales bacterium]